MPRMWSAWPCVSTKRSIAAIRARLGLPANSFLFLTLFDLNSYAARKNPRAALAASTGLPVDCIGLKATTNEGVGDLGRGLAIAAHAVCLIAKN